MCEEDYKGVSARTHCGRGDTEAFTMWNLGKEQSLSCRPVAAGGRPAWLATWLNKNP